MNFTPSSNFYYKEIIMELESAMPEYVYPVVIQEEAKVSIEVMDGAVCLVVTPVEEKSREWKITFGEEELLQVYHDLGKAIGSITVKL